MTKRLLTAFALQGAVSLPFSRPTAHAQGKYCAKRFFILLFSLAALVSFTSTGTRAQNLSVTKLRRIAPFRLNNLPEGSRVTITSDSALDDYTAYKSADRFHVLIPQAELSALLKDLHGSGFTDIQVERRGSDLDLSFVLQPGATASVTQKFNRLDVTFSVPADLVASVVVTATEATTTAQT